MSRKITDFLKNPLSDSRLKLFQSFFVFGCSILVNAYFQVNSFSALARWLLTISGAENVSEQLAEILSRTETPIGMRIAFGLLMTAFVMVFLLIAAYWEEGRKHFGHLFERACSTMLVPMLLLLAASVLMNVSFTIGVLFGIAAAIGCVAVIVNSGKKANCNGYILITTATAFFMITVVLLTRNHIVTMVAAL